MGMMTVTEPVPADIRVMELQDKLDTLQSAVTDLTGIRNLGDLPQDEADKIDEILPKIHQKITRVENAIERERSQVISAQIDAILDRIKDIDSDI